MLHINNHNIMIKENTFYLQQASVPESFVRIINIGYALGYGTKEPYFLACLSNLSCILTADKS